MEGYIRKIDLHRRLRKVEVDFMKPEDVDTSWEIEMVREKDGSRKC